MIVLALISGLILGFLFFGGLWLTVRRTMGTKYAVLWFFASALLRTSIALTGFYFVAQGSMSQLLICVAGFITARFLVLWITKQIEQKQIISTKGDKL